MQVRVRCYEAEIPEISYRLKQVFDVIEVSKFYPNVRQTSVEMVCDGYVYVKIKDFDKEQKHLKADFVACL